MRAKCFQNSQFTRKPRIDLGRILGKNHSDGLIRLMKELVKLVTKTYSKLHEPKTYNKVINNSINEN